MNRELYDRYLTAGFAKANLVDYAAVARELDLNYARWLPRDPQAPILDLGCGMGHFLYYVLQKKFTNAIGIDVSSEAVAYCKIHVSVQVECVDNPIEFLLARAGAFELIVMKDVIEHLPRSEVLPTLTAVRQALVPKGMLLIETGNMAAFTGTYLLYNDFTHQVGFTEVSLRNILSAVGFSETQIVPYQTPLNLRARVANGIWQRILKWIYHIERGSLGTPTHLSKLLIGVARP